MCGDDRAIHVDDGLLKELLGLPPPDLQPCFVEGLHQVANVVRREAAAEVVGRGRVGDAVGSQGVEIHFIVAAQFEIFQTRCSAQRVIGNVEHVIGLVIGSMKLEQLQTFIDPPIEPDVADELVNRTDAAAIESFDSCGDFVLRILRSEHCPSAIDGGRFV